MTIYNTFTTFTIINYDDYLLSPLSAGGGLDLECVRSLGTCIPSSVLRFGFRCTAMDNASISSTVRVSSESGSISNAFHVLGGIVQKNVYQ